MKIYLKIVLGGVLLIGFGLLIAFLMSGHPIPIAQTKGIIATRERNLIITTFLLMLVVVIPVLVMTLFFAWRYRSGNTKASYQPNFDHSFLAETIWWGIPCLLIAVLAVITWRSTHQLEPSKALASTGAPITIQVVALDWKWLFIYPKQHIASVNFVQFPTNVPVHFEITSAAPMNSFFIPQLSGQIYAMPGMSTNLNMIADGDGDYPGRSVNLSGKGFSGMTFIARSTSTTAFSDWVKDVHSRNTSLTQQTYAALAQPSENEPVHLYGNVTNQLYSSILHSYMGPSTENSTMMKM